MFLIIMQINVFKLKFLYLIQVTFHIISYLRTVTFL